MQLEMFSILCTEELDTKLCRSCKKHKTLDNFPYSMGGKVAKSRRSDCKTCIKQKADTRKALSKIHPRPTDNNYCCPICNNTEEKLKENNQFSDRSVWVLDHDHVEHTFRAWICNNCNIGLGKFKDDPVIIKRAMEYLYKYG